jgi:hypothetical protein
MRFIAEEVCLRQPGSPQDDGMREQRLSIFLGVELLQPFSIMHISN